MVGCSEQKAVVIKVWLRKWLDFICLEVKRQSAFEKRRSS